MRPLLLQALLHLRVADAALLQASRGPAATANYWLSLAMSHYKESQALSAIGQRPCTTPSKLTNTTS